MALYYKVFVGDEDKGLLTSFKILHLIQDFLIDKTKKIIQFTLINNSDNLFSESRYKNIKELNHAISEFRYENNLSSSEKALFKALAKLDNTLAWDIYQASYKFVDNFLI